MLDQIRPRLRGLYFLVHDVPARARRPHTGGYSWRGGPVPERLPRSCAARQRFEYRIGHSNDPGRPEDMHRSRPRRGKSNQRHGMVGKADAVTISV